MIISYWYKLFKRCERQCLRTMACACVSSFGTVAWSSLNRFASFVIIQHSIKSIVRFRQVLCLSLLLMLLLKIMSAVVELVLQFIFKFGLAPWYARRYPLRKTEREVIKKVASFSWTAWVFTSPTYQSMQLQPSGLTYLNSSHRNNQIWYANNDMAIKSQLVSLSRQPHYIRLIHTSVLVL